MADIGAELAPSKRILVVGSVVSIQGINSFPWNDIPTSLNVADFDIVVLNFTPLGLAATSETIDIGQIPSFRQFARLIFSPASETIAIGDPFFHIGANPYLESTWWLPFAPAFLRESGETITVAQAKYSFYIDHVRHWSFCMAGWQEPNPPFFRDYMAAAGLPRTENLRPRLTSIANNRYDRPIAFEYDLVAESRGGGHLGTSGKITWLPPTTEIGDGEAIPLLLKSLYGVLKEVTPPPWLSTYTLPAEVPLLQRIAGIQRDLDQLTRDLAQASDQLSATSRFKRLLYETGEGVLEPIVLDTLRILGAHIQQPPQKGKEDGRFLDPVGRLATIEIKGRAGPLRVSDVRQAHQWVADSLAYESRQSKGILIANLMKDAPPQDRDGAIPQNCRDLAQNFNICILTTTQLFKALASVQEGAFDSGGFWDAVSATAGVCPLPELT
jgi:hypothetical protein